MPMDRPHRWFAASCGLLLLVSTGGCRSTKTRIPPQPQAGAGRDTQVQLSGDPHGPANIAGMGANPPGLAGQGMPAGYMGGSASPASGNLGSGARSNLAGCSDTRLA